MSTLGQGILDDVMPEIATELVNLFGGTATIIFKGADNYVPATGGGTPDADTEVSVSASPPEPYNINAVDNSSIQQNDLKTIVPASQVTASIVIQSTELRIGSIPYKIMNSFPIKSGNDVAAYKLQIRA